MKFQKSRFILISVSIILFSNLLLLWSNIEYDNKSAEINILDRNPKKSNSWELNKTSIDGLAGWQLVVSQPWCSGSGTINNPFIIENITINGDHYGDCLKIQNSEVYFIIRNSVFYNASTGIELENVENGTIVNNTCYNDFHEGINLVDSSYCQILNNSIYDNGAGSGSSGISEYYIKCGGIALFESHHNTIYGNEIISNDKYGIALGNTKTLLGSGTDLWGGQCYHNNVSRNLIESSGDGIWTLPNSRDNTFSDNIIINSSIFLEGSHNTRLIRNDFSEGGIWFRGTLEAETSYYIETTNTVNGKSVYYYANEINLNRNDFVEAGQVILVNCEDSFIENASFNNCHDITLHYCSNILIEKCLINGGISFHQSNNSKIIENRFNDKFWLSVFYSHNNSMINNLINTTSTYFHAFVAYSHYNIISENIFLNNEFGIYLSEANNNELSKNVIKLNKTNKFSAFIVRSGIELESSENNDIFDNEILDTDIGIFLKNSRFNLVSNNFINDTDIGIKIEGIKNTIVKNIIIARNECISYTLDDNDLENNLCNGKSSEQGITGYYPSLILLATCFTTLLYCYYKKSD